MHGRDNAHPDSSKSDRKRELPQSPNPRVIPRDIIWGRYMLRTRERDFEQAKAELVRLQKRVRQNGQNAKEDSVEADLISSLEGQHALVTRLQQEHRAGDRREMARETDRNSLPSARMDGMSDF